MTRNVAARVTCVMTLCAGLLVACAASGRASAPDPGQSDVGPTAPARDSRQCSVSTSAPKGLCAGCSVSCSGKQAYCTAGEEFPGNGGGCMKSAVCECR